jgi:hypothetical protein
VLLFTNVKPLYCILIVKVLPLIENWTYAFFKHKYIHNINWFFIHKANLTLSLGSIKCNGMNKWILQVNKVGFILCCCPVYNAKGKFYNGSIKQWTAWQDINVRMDLQSPPLVLLELLFSPNWQKSSSLCNAGKATLPSIGEPASILYLSALYKYVSFKCCGHDSTLKYQYHALPHSHAELHFCLQLYV